MTGFFGDAAIQPPIPQEVMRQADRVADQAGFKYREPPREPPKKRRGSDKQLHSFTLRADMDDVETFIRWTEQERLSYREAFARLVAGIQRS
jgi:hypothetical protein